MIWLTWRQFRIPGAVTFGGLAALAIILALTGPGVAHDYAFGIATCTNTSAGCDNFIRNFLNDHQGAFLGAAVVVLVLPVLIGLFWGATLVSRELEAGTHRLVWNQSITRTRWLAVKLAIPGLAALAAGGLGSLAVTWWSSTLDQAGTDQFPRLSSFVFDARGVVPIAYSAFAFVLGVAIGMLVRRGFPAMAITLVAFVAVQLVMGMLVRPHLLPPTRATVEFSQSILDGLGRNPDTGAIHFLAKAPDPGGWLLSSQTLDSSGKVVDNITVPAGACVPKGTPGPGTMSDCLSQISRLGYSEQLTYHAPTRFWPFQWMESAIYLGLALLLAGFCFWWLRRRLA
jgi:hypothetical protein